MSKKHEDLDLLEKTNTSNSNKNKSGKKDDHKNKKDDKGEGHKKTKKSKKKNGTSSEISESHSVKEHKKKHGDDSHKDTKKKHSDDDHSQKDSKKKSKGADSKSKSKKEDNPKDLMKSNKPRKKIKTLVMALDFANLRHEDLLKEVEEENKLREEKLLQLQKDQIENELAEDAELDDIIENHEETLEELKENYQERLKNIKKKNNKNEIMTLDDQMDLLNEREWLKFKILDYDQSISTLNVKMIPLEEQFKSLVDGLKNVQTTETNHTQLRKYRVIRIKIVEDLAEIDRLIGEVNNLAYSLLPKSVTAHCKKVEETRVRCIELQEDFMEKTFYAVKETYINEKEIKALTQAYNGEKKVNSILMEQKKELQKELKTKEDELGTYEDVINECHEELDIINYTKEEAQALAIEMQNKLKGSTNPENFEIPEEEFQQVKQNYMEEWKIKNNKVETQMKKLKDKLDKKEKGFEKFKEKFLKTNEALALKKDIADAEQTRLRTTDRLRQEGMLRKQYYNMIENMKGAIKVFCRIRAINTKGPQLSNKQCLRADDQYTVVVEEPSKRNNKIIKKEYLFDHVYPESSTQKDVWRDVRGMVDMVFNGYNICVFAYGQTGSGKTFTLIGDIDNEENRGVVPRCFHRFFELIETNKPNIGTECSFYMMELYNDKLLDLMKSGAQYTEKLDIYKNEHGMVVVPQCTMLKAEKLEDMFTFFNTALTNRHIASTKMNSESSRSHLIITIMFKFSNKQEKKNIFFGKMSLCDLAGSERMEKSGVTGIHATEAVSINRALTALGDVISALTSASEGFIPYRNNKLTQLMQDSLGGTAKTLMIVTISSLEFNIHESIGSLNYATRVKTIVNENMKAADDDEYQRLNDCLKKLREKKECPELQ